MRNQLIECDSCPFYKRKDEYGNGSCTLMQNYTNSAFTCAYILGDVELDKKSVLKILHEHQKWRRGGHKKMISGTLLGIAIDETIRQLRNGSRDKDQGM